MEIFSRVVLFLCVIGSLVQTNLVDGKSVSVSVGGAFAGEPPIEAKNCPTGISPCLCEYWGDYGIGISCQRAAMTQSAIDHAFSEVRRVNGVPEGRRVSVFIFDLSSTQMTQFDLAPLYGVQLNSFYINYNYNLTKLVTSGNPEDYGSIEAFNFNLGDSPINQAGIGDAFKYFSGEMTDFAASDLELNLNSISGAEELLPGISSLTKLTSLKFTECNITGGLTSSHLKGFPMLQTIELNELTEIGENVFQSFDGKYIFLNDNNLNETSLHPNSGLAQPAGRAKELYLSFNKFTTLPEEVFAPFLDANPDNVVFLTSNPLICDKRLSWIKSRREDFESMVISANCENDEGHNVFDSDLIP